MLKTKDSLEKALIVLLSAIIISLLLCFGAILHLKNEYPGIESSTETIKP